MIYVMGMSHILPVLDACSANGLSAQLSRISNDQPPALVDWATDPAQIGVPVQVANLYVRQVAPHWGPTLALQSSPTVVGMAPGFQALLTELKAQGAQGERNTAFAFIHGEEHIHMAMREQPQPMDFLLPERPDLAVLPGRQVVPLAVVAQQVRAQIARTQAILMAIRAMQPALHVVKVLCPPTINRGAFDPGPAGQVDTTMALSPATLRLKYYLLYARLVREAAATCGIECLLPPAETVDATGYLKDEFAGDSVHGNRRYGALVLAQMHEAAGLPRPAPQALRALAEAA